MRKVLTLCTLVLILITFSSCEYGVEQLGNYTSNPFLNPIELNSENKVFMNIKFSTISDVHIGKDDEDNEITLEDQLSVYQEYLQNEKPEFILNLGDFFDHSPKDYVLYESHKKYFNDIKMLYTMGNHDIAKNLLTEDSIINHSTLYSQSLQSYTYTVDGITLRIYKLDNSIRTYYKQQIAWLEEALKQDDSEYKIFIQHIPLTPNPSDYSIAWLCLADSAERNSIIRLMAKYDVGLVMAGHHHLGDTLTKISKHSTELMVENFAFTKFPPIATPGTFYDCSFNFQTGQLLIQAYGSTDGNKINKTYSIQL